MDAALLPAPAWAPQHLLKHHLHPKNRSPKAAKRKKRSDTPHAAESGSSHETTALFQRKDIGPFLSSHCLLVAGLPRRWEIWVQCPHRLEGAQNHHLVYITHSQEACWQASQESNFKGDTVLTDVYNATSKHWVLKAGGTRHCLREGEPLSPFDYVSTGHSNRPRLSIAWISSQHRPEERLLLLAKIVAQSMLTCPGNPMTVYLTRMDAALPHKAIFLDKFESRIFFPLINNEFIFVM